MDQVSESIPKRACDEQSGQRLVRRVAAHLPTRAAALLTKCRRGLTGPVSRFASRTLDSLVDPEAWTETGQT
ncbi:MAG: hypothetical protein QOH35_1572 [Acidobacteriaceae bacterium]|nr:hypothetical protein [Acidobacteriaceae bacterium]